MLDKKGLGRGVDALMGGDVNEDEDSFFLCDIDRIEPNPEQPRSYFDPEKLEELSQSIKERGVLQPLLVTSGKGNSYSLIAGERRLRAAQMAGLQEVPVMLVDSKSESERLELAIIENIQRENLNAMEEARAYERLINEFELTQDEAAQKVGKKRSTITNALRLLKLPAEVQDDVEKALISEGHARVLLRLKDNPAAMLEIRDKIIKEKLSVRATENLCKSSRKSNASANTLNKRNVVAGGEIPRSYCQTLITQMTNHLNSKVNIVQNGSRGKVEIEYYSIDDLDRLVAKLSGGG